LSIAITDSKVALIRCEDYTPEKVKDALCRQFDLLGSLNKFVKPGDAVLIKPNLIAPKSRSNCTQTDPAVILETAKILKDYGAKPFVGDSPAWGNVFNCIKKLKLEQPLKALGVPVRQLDKPKKYKINGVTVGISSVATDADVIINLPKFKAHQQLTATFAIKNMFGTVSGKYKAYWHFEKGHTQAEFCEFLIEVYKFLSPVITIVDAVNVMEGPGPISGRPRPLGFLIGSEDPIACEAVCAKLVNIDPLSLPMIKKAVRMGLAPADFNNIQILGDSFAGNICTDFEIPPQIPVKFSLFYVFRSICKQILFRIKSVIKPDH